MLKILQVYYRDDQLPLCDFTPVKNEDCTEFFENSIIRNSIIADAHLGSEYFGVVSWNLKNKCAHPIGPAVSIPIIKSHIEDVIYKEEQLCPRFDIFGFVKYQPHDPIWQFYNVHPKLPHYFKMVTDAIGYNWQPENFDHIFYSNHFIAKSEIYEKYVIEMLSPAMTVMSDMPELWQDSGYPCPLPNALAKKWNTTHYPLHTFICERLFSYFVHLHKFNVKYF